MGNASLKVLNGILVFKVFIYPKVPLLLNYNSRVDILSYMLVPLLVDLIINNVNLRFIVILNYPLLDNLVISKRRRNIGRDDGKQEKPQTFYGGSEETSTEGK